MACGLWWRIHKTISVWHRTGKNGWENTVHLHVWPNICGAGKQFTQFIVGYDKLKHRRQATRPQTYHHLRKRLHCETDKMTHLYTLIIRPDNTYEYRVDNSRVDGGYLEEDFGILPPEKITDPLAKKPDGWAEDSMLPDPNHQMPAGYGKEPKYVLTRAKASLRYGTIWKMANGNPR